MVYLMRSIPGGGKSTWVANEIARLYLRRGDYAVCSADHFFVRDNDQKYMFVPEKLGEAHTACLRSYLNALLERTKFIFVDNTNIHAWELAPYVTLAAVFGREATIVRVECDPFVALSRNVHGVPPQTVGRMWATLLAERLPAHWKETVVSDISD